MKHIVLLLILVSAFAKAQQTPPIFKKAKIYFDQSHTRAGLHALEIAADHGISKEGVFLISDFSTTEIESARTNGYEVDILIEDVKAFYQNPSRTAAQANNVDCSSSGTDYETPANFNQGTMGGYLTYQELLDELDDMVTQYPDLISARAPISDFLTEGQPDTSVTPSIGSNPIYWLKISDNPNNEEAEAQILYTSIHHAREPMSLMQLVFYMWYLLENYEDDPEVQAIVNNTELYFVPVVNPDGYLFNQVTDPNGGGLWRKNRKNGNGVDNNRNYDYHINGDPNDGSWGGPGSSSNPNTQTFHGSGPFSEVENQAIKWFVEQHNFVLALNNHTFGQLLYYPFGYADVATPDDALYQGLGAELTSVNGYNALRDSPFSGDSDDFMYGTVGTHEKIFAFTPEIGSSFWPPASTIIDTAKDMMFLNLTAAQIANNYGSITETSPTFVGTATDLSSSFSLRRLGVAGTGDFTVSLQPVSSNITTTGDAVSLTGLIPLAQQSGSITYSLETTIEEGDAIEFDLVINNGLFDNAVRVSKIYGNAAVLLEEPGDGLVSFENTAWGTTTTTFVSPSSSITDSPSGNYSNNENNTITLAEGIDLTTATVASVSYHARWDIEDTWDYVQFQISTDNGATWEAQCGNFTTTASNIQPAGEPLYDGVQTAWVLEEIDLSDYLGELILARFQLVTDSDATRDGFYFDDLTFVAFNDDTLDVSDTTFSSAFSLYPNPISNVLHIRTALASYSTSIYNVLGQQVYTTKQQQGNATLDYTSFKSGIYFVRIESDRESAVFKVVKS